MFCQPKGYDTLAFVLAGEGYERIGLGFGVKGYLFVPTGMQGYDVPIGGVRL